MINIYEEYRNAIENAEHKISEIEVSASALS